MKSSSKLERFNNTLSELDGELAKLKGTSQAYKKLEELSKSYELIVDKFKRNSQALDELAKKQLAKHQEIRRTLADITKDNSDNFQQLKKLNDAANKTLNKSVEEIRKENKRFYIDFEKVVRIKLNENKSEIKQLIENERLQIKEVIENKLDKQSAEIKQTQEKTNKLIWILGGVSILFLIGILVKLFV